MRKTSEWWEKQVVELVGLVKIVGKTDRPKWQQAKGNGRGIGPDNDCSKVAISVK